LPKLPQGLRGRGREGPAALLALALGVAAGVGCGGEEPARAPGGAEGSAPPRLVLLLVVDQLRADRLDPSLPGGLGRLAREGRVFPDARLDHAHTETCPGHVAAATGRHPGPAGIPGNRFVERESGVERYCVEDPAPGARVHGAPAGEGASGRSPRSIRASALGDWLRQAHPQARVFSLSAKDRAAIALGGQRPDAAFWLDREGALGFTTSAYYLPELPGWLAGFNGDGDGAAGEGFLGELPAAWDHPSGAPANGARRDDYPPEIDRFRRTAPHPLRGPDRAATLQRLYASPFADEVTLALARRLVEAEGLGDDAVPDLLALGLSATDVVGHYYGPWSQESRDALLRLDAALGRFLTELEERTGPGGLAVGLTADHGVLALPEWLAETGRSACPVRGGRVDARGLGAALEVAVSEALGGDSGGDHGPWLIRAGHRLTVNRPRARAADVAPERVVAAAREMLARQPVVARVWTAAELEAGEGPRPWADLYRNSHAPDRGGDLIVQPREDCLIGAWGAGTTHGTPYLYDRAVPLVLWGAGVAPGRVRGPARVVDLAPSLAALLELAPPPEVEGRALALR